MAAALLVVAGAGPVAGLSVKTGKRQGTLNVHKGFRYVGVDVSGSTDAFLAYNRSIAANALASGGRFEQTLRVDVDMEVLPRLSVRGRFDDTLFPAKQALALDYEGDQVQVTGGDIVAGFAGAEFPMENQSLFGVRGNFAAGKHALTAVAAKVSGAAGHFEAQGDNTKGPFFLPDRKLVPGSERVLVDGVRKFAGTDYTMDHATGVLNFTSAVDDRYRIVVDYEYDALLGFSGQNLFISRYAGEITTSTSLGLSAGTRRGGTAEIRNLLGLDGRHTLPGGVTLGGEMALGRAAAAGGRAVRAEASGSLAGVSWSATGRTIDRDYSGLGSVAPRKDTVEGSLGASWAHGRSVRVSTRLAGSRDNVSRDPSRPGVRDLVADSSVAYLLPARTRMELTFDNRNELHRDDLERHQVDASATAYRVGARYRLDRHLLRTSYEIRFAQDRAGDRSPREHRTHVAAGQVQSRLSGSAFATGTLQLSRSLEEPSGRVTGEELLTGMDVSASLLRYLAGSTSYTVQDRAAGARASAQSTGTGSRTHSAVVSLRTQSLGNLSGETSLSMRRHVPERGPASEDAALSARLGYQIGASASASADYQRRVGGARSNASPATIDLRGTWRPATGYDLGVGYRIDQFRDPESTARSYTARVAYVDATVTF
jgi:hypothetical protein